MEGTKNRGLARSATGQGVAKATVKDPRIRGTEGTEEREKESDKPKASLRCLVQRIQRVGLVDPVPWATLSANRYSWSAMSMMFDE